MRHRIEHFWQSFLIRADEWVTRSARLLAPNRQSAGKQALRLDQLEPRLLFSATPLDPTMIPSGDDIEVVETMALEDSGAITESTHLQVNSLVESEPSEIVVVDAAVDDLQSLLDDLHASERNLQVFVLDGDRDGIEQISEILDQQSSVGALHLISHGTAGGIQLGNLYLTEANLDGYAGQLVGWQNSLAANADILFYGCDLAGSQSGIDLIDSLSALTGADVAASDDVTGHSRLNGDWHLEYQVGVIESSIVTSGLLQQSWWQTLDIATGLFSHHTFDTDGSDSSGNGFNGDLENGASINTDSGTNLIGSGKLSLDGANDYVDLSDHAAAYDDLSAGTVAAWIYWNGSSTQSTIFEIADSGDSASHWGVGVDDDGALNVYASNNSSNLFEVDTADNAIATNTWTHVAITVDGSGNRLYIDGVQAGGLTYKYGSATSTEFFDSISAADYVAWGRDRYSTNFYRHEFDGFIDEGRVYDRALSADDVAELAIVPNFVPIADSGTSYTIQEGEDLVLDASGSSDGNADSLTYTWDVDGDGLYDDATGVNPTLTWAELAGLTLPIDDDGNYTVTVRVDDGKGGVATDSSSLVVTNVVPVITVTGDATVDEDAAYSINLSAIDPGNDTITQWHVDWGDGTQETFNTPFPATFDHVYAEGGTYNVLVAATDEDGTWVQNDLYVVGAVNLAGGGRVFRFDANTGEQLDRFGGSANIPWPVGIVINEEGNLLVSNYQGQGAIREFTPDGTDLGNFASGLDTPTGMVFDLDGTLWVSEFDDSSLTQFDADGNVLQSVSVGFEGTGFARHPNGMFYVAANDTGQLYEFDGVTATAIAGGMNAPKGIAVGPDGNLYVADQGNELIRIFDTAGNQLDSFSVPDPHGIAFGPDGLMYVSSYEFVGASSSDDRIIRYENSGGTTWTYLDDLTNGGRSGVTLDGPKRLLFFPEHRVSVTPIANTPSITASSTIEDTQTTSGLVISRNALDGEEVTHFKITGITGGSLFLNDGVTEISDNEFITAAQGQAGLKFTPDDDSNNTIVTATFKAQSSLSDSDAGLGGLAATADLSVTEVNDAPELIAGTVANLTVNEDSGFTSLDLGLVAYGPGGGTDELSQTITYSVSAIPTATLGAVYLADQVTAVMTGTYTLAEIQGMVFRPEDNASGITFFQWSVTDNGTTNALADPQGIAASITILVNPQSDVPIIGGTVDSVINDTQTAQPFSTVTIEENDGQNVTTVITLSSGDDNGSFTSASLTSSGFAKSGVGQYTLSNTAAAAAQSAIRQLVFDPSENQVASGSSVTTSFMINVNDGDVAVNDGSTDLTVASLNDAPTIGAGSLATSGFNDFTPPGATIVSLFGGSFADVDADSGFGGIVVVGNTTNAVTEGVWQYSSDVGANWFEIGSVDDAGNGLALSATSKIRFVPVSGFSGAPTSLVVRGLDDSYAGAYSSTSAGEVRSTVNTSSPSANTAFSSSSTTLATSVDANAAPTIDGTVGGQVVNDNATITPFTTVTIADAESNNVSVTVTLSGGDASGFFTSASLTATAFTKSGDGEYRLASTTAAAAQAAIRGLVFDPTENLVSAGASADTVLTIAVDDGSSVTMNAATDVSSVSVNDAPIISNGTLGASNEGDANPPGATVASIFGSAITDVDISSGLSGIVITENTANAASQGAWQYSSDGVNWSDVGVVNDANGLVVGVNSRVRFLSAGDFHGTPADLRVRGLDDSYAGSVSVSGGGEIRQTLNTSSPNATSSFSNNTATLETFVNNTNDPPTLDDFSRSMFAGGTLRSRAIRFDALSNDVDGDALTAVLVTGTANGVLDVNADGSFEYTPDTGFTGIDTFQWTAFDGVASSSVATVTIEVQPFLVIGVLPVDPVPNTQPEPQVTPDSEADSGADSDANYENESESESEDASDSDDSATTPIPPSMTDNDPDFGSDTASAGNTSERDGETSQTTADESINNLVRSEEASSQSGFKTSTDTSSDTRIEQWDAQAGLWDSLTETLSASDSALMREAGAFWEGMDRQRDRVNSHVQSDIIMVGAAGAAASSFTVGYVAWAVRSGFLLSGVLAQIPAWQAIDPLTIMQGLGSGQKTETLEQLMERKEKSVRKAIA
ncbi:MAG: DUF4347 domain-containing protein [Planctomycetota bacterium]